MAPNLSLDGFMAELGLVIVGLVVGVLAMMLWQRIGAWRQARTLEWDPY